MIFKILMALWPFIKEVLFGKKDPMLVMHHNPTASVLGVTCIILSVTTIGFMYSSFMLSQELTQQQAFCPKPEHTDEIRDLQQQLLEIKNRIDDIKSK